MDTQDWLLKPSDNVSLTASDRISVEQLRQLSKRSNRAGVARLSMHIGALALTGFTLMRAESIFVLTAMTLFHGYLLAFLFCAQHESAHRTAFASKRINDFIGHAVGFLLFLPHHAFRAFHWDHHRHTQDQARDPELASGLPKTMPGIFWLWLGGPNWIGRLRSFYQHAIRARVVVGWIPSHQHRLIVSEARWYLVGYGVLLLASLAMQTSLLIWIWLVPLFCGYWFLRPYLLAEHTGCPDDGDRNNLTRTTYTNGLIRLFAWNMPYHTEHHAYPAVPFYALPDLHKQMKTHLRNTEPGYRVAWLKIVRFLRHQSPH